VSRQLWELLISFSPYPEPLFGGALRLALFAVLPAAFVGYIPARVVQALFLSDVVLLAGGAIAYMGLAVMVFEYGLRRYASASRFTTFG
jgi:ABC-2 type transport system permease protein